VCNASSCRYLADLELHVHLAAEDVDAALEADSSRALQRIPAAVQEVSHLHVSALASAAPRCCAIMHTV